MSTLDCDFLVDDVGLDEACSDEVEGDLPIEGLGEEELIEEDSATELPTETSSSISDQNLSQARDLLTAKLRHRIRLLAKERLKKKRQARELEAQARQLTQECQVLRSQEKKLETRIERLEDFFDSDEEHCSQTTSHTIDSTPKLPLLNLPAKHSDAHPPTEDYDFSVGVVSSARSSARRSVKNNMVVRQEVDMLVNLYRAAHRGVDVALCETQRSVGESEVVNHFLDVAIHCVYGVRESLRTAELLDRRGHRVKALEVLQPFVAQGENEAVRWAARQLWSRGAFAVALKLQRQVGMTKNAQVTKVHLTLSENLNLIQEIAYSHYTQMADTDVSRDGDWADLRVVFRFVRDISRRQNNDTMNQVRARARELTQSRGPTNWDAVQALIVSLATLMSMAFLGPNPKVHADQWRRAADAGDPLGAVLLRRYAKSEREHPSLARCVTGEALVASGRDVKKLLECATRGSVAACERLRVHVGQLDVRALERLAKVNSGAIPLLVSKLVETGKAEDLRRGLSLARELVNRQRVEKADDLLLLATLLERVSDTAHSSLEERHETHKEAIYRAAEALQLSDAHKARSLLERLLLKASDHSLKIPTYLQHRFKQP